MTAHIFHLIAHTHWDREWYLPRGVFHARFVPMFDELIERLNADAGFRSFLLDGQTVLGRISSMRPSAPMNITRKPAYTFRSMSSVRGRMTSRKILVLRCRYATGNSLGTSTKRYCPTP